MKRLGLVLVFAIGGAVTLLAATFGLAILRGHGCDTVSERALTMDARSAVMSFVDDQGRCPSGEAELLYGRYLRASWTDRWGTQLFYTCVAAGEGVDVSVRSAGPDRAFWTADDIVAAQPTTQTPSASLNHGDRAQLTP